jgi:predicted regulator of Ras-like GTPase activity (Roadblock/LC7/MglB family)
MEVAELASGEPSDLSGQLEAILQGFKQRVRGVKGCLLADSQGMPLASVLPGGLRIESLAALGTLLSHSAEDVCGNVGMRAPSVITLESPDGMLLIGGFLEDRIIFICLLERKANVGLARIELPNLSHQLAGACGLAEIKPEGSRLQELFIIHRSGVLIKHYSRTIKSEKDEDILSGMLVGILGFAREAWASNKGDLQEMRYRQERILFLRGRYTIAALVVSGSGSDVDLRYRIRDILGEFEEKYGHVLEHWQGEMADFEGVDDVLSDVRAWSV